MQVRYAPKVLIKSGMCLVLYWKIEGALPRCHFLNQSMAVGSYPVHTGYSPSFGSLTTSKKAMLAPQFMSARHRWILKYTLLWAVVAMMAALSLLRSSRKASLVEMNRQNFSCHGDSIDTRKCILHDVVLVEGVIFLFDEDPLLTVPPMLCTTVNREASHAVACNIRVISDAAVFASLVSKTKDTRYFEIGIALHRLNPNNAYHTIFEDIVPMAAMIFKAGNISGDDPARAVRTLQQQEWGVFLTDHIPGKNLDEAFWEEFLPEVTIVPLSLEAYHVKTLLAGTGTPCSHWGHCRPSNRPIGIFDPSDAAVTLRRLVFHRYGIHEENEEGRFPMWPRQGLPRVTLVQRSAMRGRQIKNLKEVMGELEAIMKTPPRLVDMADLSISEQISLAHDTDILVLVHGGALANLLWLPPGALIIDIYPQGFMVSDQSALIHSIRKALEPGLDVGHLPFQVEKVMGQEVLTGPLPPGCVCASVDCQIHIFTATTYITVDPDRFGAHLQEGLRLWRQGKYPPAMSVEEFLPYSQADQERRNAVSAIDRTPLCWEEGRTG